MKKANFVFLILSFLTSLFALQTRASSPEPSARAESKPIFFEGVDISPLVQHYQVDVKILKRPIVVYNWSPNGRSIVQKNFITNSFVIREVVRQATERYWRKYGTSSNNTMGMALYAANDPVYTYGYGGLDEGLGNDRWLLIEMTLPKGFRLLETIQPSTADSPANESVNRVLNRFGCPSYLEPETAVIAGGSHLGKSCQELMRKVLKNILQIDGFNYQYSQTYFTNCEPSDIEPAFVITSSRFINGKLIKVFTKGTTSFRDDRLRIQTLFQSNVGSPKIVSPSTPLFFGGGQLLWDDLRGQPKVDTANWLKQYRYGCDGTLPY